MDKVLIAPATLANIGGPFLDALNDAKFELVFPPKADQLSENELLELLTGTKAAIAGSEPYTRRVMEAHPQLRVVARAGVGYDAVDCQAASELGVAVCTTPNTNQDAVAEQTFAMILGIAKDIVHQHLGTCNGTWPRRANLPLRGRTLGVAGLGRIGKAVAIRGHCFKMRLLAFEPYQDHEFAKQYGVTFVSWEELLAESDFLSLHMPLTPESRHIINRDSLAKMKPSSYLVNTARGGLVCEADLIEALQNKQIEGAALDVFETEPPGDNPLLKMRNVLATPHAAGVDLQSRDDMAYSAAKAIIDLRDGNWPTEKVMNPDVKAKFSW